MRVAYLEMIGGTSGNMLLGALIDAGADPAAIEAQLRTIPVAGWNFEHTRTVKAGIAAAYVDFAIPGEDHGPGEMVAHGHHLADILALIDRSGLSAPVRERAGAIYRRLAQAEATVHGTTVEDIHFHEVGQIDAVLDVAGVCVALELLGIERVMCSAFPIGRGSISMHHGQHYPNPPPATAELLRGAPTIALDITGELVTTTGAAILTTLVSEPGVRPSLRFDRIGYGAGRSDFAIPNVTRAIVGELIAASRAKTNGSAPGSVAANATGVVGGTQPADGGARPQPSLDIDEIAVLEANVDDMSPQAFELAIERIFAAGAVDVWTAPIAMKKQRPAILLGALAPLGAAEACARAILRETSSIGVRMRTQTRWILPREIIRTLTPYGEIRIKRVSVDGLERTTVEYDDVARIARERGLPFGRVADELARLVESENDRDERRLV